MSQEKDYYKSYFENIDHIQLQDLCEYREYLINHKLSKEIIQKLMIEAATLIFGGEPYDLRDELMSYYCCCPNCESIGPQQNDKQPIANYICKNCSALMLDVNPDEIYDWQTALRVRYQGRFED
ncbi:hypothetical protein AhnVgp096 [Adoxophyes honmai nucleopolyhedrovirus]|uniref:Uncharacterized protein n=1 Tax=Adoxophyes honmai nucleopolyhedrovirus TaxID=224399 RepID=Q80LK0_NPVAH|nr:hypothetical protein AhnVgp096 [Adoxophyes honmai nucleopolyhedrovirus]BAC67347.1 hypothetical protein [Adoxophyes honmai nucleopolyhedrovirus]